MTFDDDPGAYRYAAATYIKYLLLARESDEPGYLTAEMRERWQLQGHAAEQHSAHKWLAQAKSQLAELDVSFSDPGGSLGIGTADDVLGEVQVAVSFLVSSDSIVEAERTLRDGAAIDWNRLLCWDELPEIRRLLDQLPHYQQHPGAPSALLLSWREILSALGRDNNDTERRRIASLNRDLAGPIVLGEKGEQPKADRDQLIAWWNGLMQQWESSRDEKLERERQQRLSAPSTHDYGRDGTVVPELRGEVKRRRKGPNSSG